MIYLYAFLGVLVVSLASLAGVFFLSKSEDSMRRYLTIFIGLATGALLGNALIHLIPEALEESTSSAQTSILVIGGILLFFILEKFLHWHHHGEDQEEPGIHPVGRLVLFSDGIHNFLDGIIIGASFLVSVPVGVATTLAVVLHEIPQEVGDFAVLLHAGYSRGRALWLNFLSALAALLGVIVLFAFGELAETSARWLLPIAAGGFIYIAIADLMPELHKNKELRHVLPQLASVLVGVLAMLSLTFLE